MKRYCDIVLSTMGLLILAPLLAAITVVIAWFEGRPIFYAQLRVGQFGVPFRIWKFRTMVEGAELLGGPLTVGNDRRITPLGRYLRKWKLDELPQLWNVLRGDMSFVGPRPEVPEYVVQYTPEQREVLQLKPGITDMASIQFRAESQLLSACADEVYLNVIVPEKIRINLDYARRSSVWADLVVIIRTVIALMRKHPSATVVAQGAFTERTTN